MMPDALVFFLNKRSGTDNKLKKEKFIQARTLNKHGSALVYSIEVIVPCMFSTHQLRTL